VARKVEDDKGGTMRLGAYTANLKKGGSKVAGIYGTGHRGTAPAPL
jgi:CTP synthase